MGGLGIYNHNPFTVPFLLFSSIIIARHFLASYPNRYRPFAQKFSGKLYYFVLFLAILSIFLTCVFETYFYSYECRVSETYYQETLLLAKLTADVLGALGIAYWVDYGTLLAVLRGQTINRWDHDIDFSIFHPGKKIPQTTPPLPSSSLRHFDNDFLNDKLLKTKITSIDELIKEFQNRNIVITYSEKRNLLQIFQNKDKKGPHIDIWVWIPVLSEDGSSLMLESLEKDANYRIRYYSEIFPVHATKWDGVMDFVYIPAKSHTVSEKEFRKYGGSYMVPLITRGDCFHNLFQMRWAY